MSTIDRLASSLGRADEVPNQTLAKEIAEQGDHDAVRELIDHLNDKNRAIQHDCIKVLYEIGALQPDLITDYVEHFIKLLRSRDNRMVWGGMTALGAIAEHTAPAIWNHIKAVMEATEQGSAITEDWGIRVLATVSAQNKQYEATIFPFLITFLTNCPTKDLPRHAESALVAVNADNRAAILPVLDARRPYLSAAQLKRVEQVVRKINVL